MVLESMEARRMPTGRMAYELKYFGASTGRWSGGGGLNLQRLNRKIAKGVDLRRAIVAPSGHVLASLDFSQIESRVLLFLAGDTEDLRLFRENPEADAYGIHARRTMGYAEPEPLKAWCDRTGSNLRQLAQARVLGLGFGCGWRKFIDVARVMAGLELSEDDSKGVVEKFRDSNPLICRLWQRLEDACEARDGGHYALPLPCVQHNPALKRFLFYRDVAVSDDGITATVVSWAPILHAGTSAAGYGCRAACAWWKVSPRFASACSSETRRHDRVGSCNRWCISRRSRIGWPTRPGSRWRGMPRSTGPFEAGTRAGSNYGLSRRSKCPPRSRCRLIPCGITPF